MKFTVPRFEVRYRGEVNWEDICELHLMQRLSEIYDRITPEILHMLKGEQVQTPEAVYRLKSKDNFKFL
jgi:hypothetical protein